MTSAPTPDPSGALGAAAGLTEALNGMADRLAEVQRDSEERDAALKKSDDALMRSGRRNRVLIVVDVVLTVVVAVLAVLYAHVSNRADAASAHATAASVAASALHAAQISGCVAGNQERAGELALWTYLSGASKPASRAQAEAIDKFMAIVKTTFAARQCATAYPLPKGNADGTG